MCRTAQVARPRAYVSFTVCGKLCDVVACSAVTVVVCFLKIRLEPVAFYRGRGGGKMGNKMNILSGKIWFSAINKFEIIEPNKGESNKLLEFFNCRLILECE